MVTSNEEMEKFDMIYIVMGSEDGYLKTFTSKKKALEYGKWYILQVYSEMEAEQKEKDIEVREYDHGIYLSGLDATVDIHKDEISR